MPRTENYFPLEVGQRWVYDTRLYGPNPRSTTTTVAVCRVRRDEDGDLLHLVATCADDDLIQAQLLYLLGEEVVEPVSFDSQGEPRGRTPALVLARTRMAVGQQWRWVGRLSDGDEQRTDLYRVANRGRVVTPAGEFDAVRLLVSHEAPRAGQAAVERWYAPGVGMVSEAGSVLFPLDGRVSQLELVRTLREVGVVPVSQISCCARLPGG